VDKPHPPQDLRWTCECDCPCMTLVEFAQDQMTPELKLLCRPCLDGDHGQDTDRTDPDYNADYVADLGHTGSV
jgi:hypothetical protein